MSTLSLHLGDVFKTVFTYCVPFTWFYYQIAQFILCHFLSLYLMLWSRVRVRIFYRQLLRARRRYGQLSHLEPSLPACSALHQQLRASHIPTYYYSNCFSYSCFIGYSNSRISKAKVKHSISTTAIAQTGPVKIDFISLSLKPDRGNRVICSPTLLSLTCSGCLFQTTVKSSQQKSRHT